MAAVGESCMRGLEQYFCEVLTSYGHSSVSRLETFDYLVIYVIQPVTSIIPETIYGSELRPIRSSVSAVQQ